MGTALVSAEPIDIPGGGFWSFDEAFSKSPSAANQYHEAISIGKERLQRLLR